MAADVFTSVIAVAIVLGIMILVHEWGHFIAAKLFGVRVEVFSFGFGPRLWGRKRGPTDYRISALPLGGYVKMAGDNPSEERRGEPDEFLSKPRWQRALIAVAGPAMNMVMAVALTTGLFLVGTQQRTFVDKPVEVAGVIKDSPAEAAGLRAGDRVEELAGIRNPTWERALLELVFTNPGSSLPLVVERDGNRVPLTAHATAATDFNEVFAVLGYPAEPVAVGTVSRGMPAERSGLRPGDHVLAVERQPVRSPIQFAGIIQQRGGQPTELLLQRGDQTLRVEIRPEWNNPGDGGGARWQIGIAFRFASEKRSYSLGGAAERGLWVNARLTRQILHVVSQLFQGRMSLKQMQGPLGIARESGRAARRGPLDLINLMAVISLNLAILNLLPIPILDGGHLLMLAVEGVIRRDLSLTVKERVVQVGLVFLLVIFAIVMYNDVLRLLPSH
ncbi:MAG: RIP metalloprotease RseP [Acidobacteria bacterium]|nr:RIP metalloprotease RseP [Acidobacteriota bacterium]